MTWVARNAKWIVGVAVLLILGMAAWSALARSEYSSRVHIGDAILTVDIADTDATRQRGLSGVQHMADHKGMLFIYEDDDRWGIWMRDMHMDIDVIWLDSDRRVVHIVKNMRPDTYPKVFRPEKSARYVLEVNAGVVERRGVTVGAKAHFELPEQEGVQ